MDLSKNKSIGKMIVFTAGRLVEFANNNVFKPIGLTSSGIIIMHIIKQRNAIMPSELLKFIGGTKSNITQRLNFLEKNGLIARSPSPNVNDRRKIIVKLTSRGIAKLKEAQKLIDKKNIDLEKYFSKKDIASNLKFMDKINQIIDGEGVKSCKK